MRNKIDYGIDLGTTNSAIARMENGLPVIKKTDTLKDTLPSCVCFNKKQDILVGDIALNAMKNDNTRSLKTFEKSQTNTFIEFKRTMGTTTKYESSNMNKSFTSDELSSEVLKKLKSFIQDENISSIIITVPAKFLNPQKEATMKAAHLAGFKQVQLLQEPVAAATAYGIGANKTDGYWCVFDFGGGTFDVALIKSEESILSVKDTEGDNWLGGKNLDEAIIDKIIIPYIKENYKIHNILGDSIKMEILRNVVKPYAEEAKIQLSFKDSHNILSNLGDLPFVDESGVEPEIDITVNQQNMENVLSPIFQKVIDITKDLLKRNNLSGNDLSALLLVGGPTHSPILRRMLKEQITDKVDTSIDPMTVVAKGAALFASTVSLSEEIQEEKRDKTKIQLDLKYEATSVELDEIISMKILKDKTVGILPSKIYADIVRADGAWASGKKEISEKTNIFEIMLIEGRTNLFIINLYDEIGNKLEGQPEQFSVLQGIGGLDGMQVLPYHIGIGKFFSDEGKDLFASVKGLEKNKRIPATGVINGLKTRSTIRPGISTDIIRIPIYQGDYNADKTNPILNNLINEVIISGESLPALLPSGSNVDIIIKVDQSEVMHFSAFFPTLNHTEELKIEIKQKEPPTEKYLSKEIKNAKETAEKVNSAGISKKLNDLENQLENEKGSADGKLKILDGLRKELLELSKFEKENEWTHIEKNLKEDFYGLENMLMEYKKNNMVDSSIADKINMYIEEFKSKIEEIIKTKNIKEAKDIIEKIHASHFSILYEILGNELFVQHLKSINNNFASYMWTDPGKARQLINHGLQMVNNGDISSIRILLSEIFELMPEDEKSKDTLE